MAEFVRLRIGPVIMKDEIEYHQEVGLLQEVTITLAIAGISEDGSRFLMRNEIIRQDGKLCARVTSAGGWLDLLGRKLVCPPEKLLAALKALTKTDDFKILPSSIKQQASSKQSFNGMSSPCRCSRPLTTTL